MSKLEHIATIDYCYWRLEKLNEALSKPKSTMEQLVDKACGYNEVEEVKKEAIALLEQIVESKKHTCYVTGRGQVYFLNKFKTLIGA